MSRIRMKRLEQRRSRGGGKRNVHDGLRIADCGEEWGWEWLHPVCHGLQQISQAFSRSSRILDSLVGRFPVSFRLSEGLLEINRVWCQPSRPPFDPLDPFDHVWVRFLDHAECFRREKIFSSFSLVRSRIELVSAIDGLVDLRLN